MEEAVLLEGYEQNPGLTIGRARALKKAFKARGRAVPASITAKLRAQANRKRGRKKGRKKRASSNPKRRRKKGRKRERASSNPKRKLGRKRKRRKASANPRRRKRHYKKRYKSNPKRRRKAYRNPMKLPLPKGMQGIKKIAFYKPNLVDYKKAPLPGIGLTLLGWIDTSIYGLIIDLATTGMKKDTYTSTLRDVVRWIGKFCLGTLTGFAIAKITKKEKFGQFHQTGVYISMIFDLIGTAIKHASRVQKGIAFQGFEGVDFSPTIPNIAIEMFGFGQIHRALAERKIVISLQKGEGISVVKTGKTAKIKNMTTGEVLLSGTIDGCQKTAGRITGAGAEHFGYVGKSEPTGILGEDITVEGI